MTLIAALVNVVLLLYVTRRLLGVPIGWGRVAIVSFITNGFLNDAAQLYLDTFQIDPSSPQLAALALTVVVLGCVVTAQMIVLTVIEAFLPTVKVPALTAVLTGMPAWFRRLRRYAGIWWILLRRGLTAYLGPTPNPDLPTPRVARSLRLALTDAGVTFVKFGQMLATRADLLPPAVVAELSKLHSEVAAEPWAEVRPAVAYAVARPLDEVFSELSDVPMAAASVAQIHAATLVDGTEVVVKVQRPKARKQVTADLDILHRFAARLEQQTSWGRAIGAVALAEGFAQSLHEELDYRIEIANMRGVARTNDLIVPEPFDELSSSEVIVMERLAGKPLSSAGAELAALSAERRKELAEELLGGVLQQIFVSGVFHADLHPGNVVLTSDGLALLDFGSVGRLDRPVRMALVMLLYAVERQDSIAATDALLDLLDRPADLDDRVLEREIGSMIVRYGDGLAPGGAAAVFTELINLVARHGFRVPPQLAAVFRTLGTLDGTLRLLDPGIDLVGVARARGSELAKQITGPAAVKEQAEHQLATLLPVLARLPRRLSRISEQLEDGTLTVNVRSMGDVRDRAWVAGVAHQLNVTLLASMLGIGGTFLITRDGGAMLLPTFGMFQFLGLVCLFLAFTLGTRVLAHIFFHSR
ncbi:ABC1 kinase family protein [Granulicoccus sp. GXG6511]|uniref:ABC1 kinase family protein n=1 Tax=Granulicoccus sp. GXG6511 TaxID=3381351 RepID=UPI003D7E8E01